MHRNDYSSEQGLGKFVRWRGYENTLAEEIMSFVGGHVVPYEEFERAAQERFQVLGAAFELDIPETPRSRGRK